jgi:hypothetical protein
MILYMFQASHAHLQEDIVYLQYICRAPLLIGATYGSIQSVRIPDTANIQCPPEDEHVMFETCRGS